MNSAVSSDPSASSTPPYRSSRRISAALVTLQDAHKLELQLYTNVVACKLDTFLINTNCRISSVFTVHQEIV